jgi:hypothetical protein
MKKILNYLKFKMMAKTQRPSVKVSNPAAFPLDFPLIDRRILAAGILGSMLQSHSPADFDPALVDKALNYADYLLSHSPRQQQSLRGMKDAIGEYLKAGGADK